MAVTAFAANSDRDSARRAGFNDYLSKPYHAKDLLGIVARLLNEHREENGSVHTDKYKYPTDK